MNSKKQLFNKRLVAITFFIAIFVSPQSYAQTTETFTTPGASTWICPIGVTSVAVECWGAGGGGGNSNNGTGKGGFGGGGGAYGSSTLTVVPGTTYYFSVGAGGAGAPTGIGNATSGGSTWFNTSNTQPTSTAGVLAGGGGLGGNDGGVAGTAGTAIYWLTTGTAGNVGGANSASGGGTGGNGGNGGAGGAGTTNDAGGGLAGTIPGGGGGGSSDNASSWGGAGANGRVVLVYTAPAYCTSTGSSSSYYINNFSTTGGLTNITNNVSGYSSSGYLNATAMVVTQVAGGTVNVSSSFVGGTFGFSVFVDWNNDVDFVDAGEKVAGTAAYASSFSGSFAVPGGQATGNYRMRIVANYNSPTPISCNSGISGETEDYTLTVGTLAAPTVTSFTPTSGCSSVTSFTITGTNFTAASAVKIGGTAVTSYTVNSATQITATVGTGTTGTVSITTPGGTGTSAGTFTVNTSPTVAAIGGGAAAVCTSSATPAFTDATAGGVWSITNGTGAATITAGGVASGTSVGTTTVVYTVTSGGCSNTATASLTVNTVSSITANPSNSSITSGNNTSFSATGNNSPTSYIWEVSTNGGTIWSTISNGGVYSGATTATLNLTGALLAMNSYKYRATAVNSCGNSAVSTVATLTVLACNAPSAPTAAATPVTSITQNGMTINWVNPATFDKILVVVKPFSAISTDPVNGNSYTANSILGSGSQLADGSYIVYNGSSNSVTITGLTSSVQYYYAIYAYNTCESNKYNMVELTGNATTSAPIGLSYTFASTSGTFTANSGGTNVCTSCGDSYLSAAISLPFTFYYGGCTSTAYTQIKVSSNGYIGLGTAASTTSLYDVLTNTSNGPIISPFAEDLNGGTISYKTTGTSPNQVFTIEWLNSTSWNASGTISFQIKLYETTNKIEFIYNRGTITLPDAGISAAVGLTSGVSGDYYYLTNLSSTPAANYGPTAVQNIADFPASGQIYTWTLPTAMSYISTTVSAATTDAAYVSTNNQAITKIAINVPGSCSPYYLTQLLMSMSPTTLSDVTNVDVYYTGTENAFSASTLFGSGTPATNITINGVQLLQSGINYFWIVYDIPATAVIGHTLTASCSQITLSGAGNKAVSGSGSRTIAAVPGTFAQWAPNARSYCVVIASDADPVWAGGDLAGNALIVKTSPDLATIKWCKTYSCGTESRITKIIQTSDGFVGVGVSNVSGVYNIFVIKVNTSGVKQWAQTFEGTATSSTEQAGICLITTGAQAGNVAICGNLTNDGYFAVISNSTGAIIAQKNINPGAASAIMRDIVQTTDGGFIMAGKYNNGSNYFYVAKLKNDFSEDWDAKWGLGSSSDDGLTFITENAANDYTVGGTIYSDGFGSADGYAARFSYVSGAKGINVAWSRAYGSAESNKFNSGIKTADGNYAFTGVTTRLGDALNDEAFIVKITTGGSNIFMKSIGTLVASEDEEGYGIAEQSDHNLIIGGLHNNGSLNFYVARLTNTGYCCAAVQDNGGVFTTMTTPAFSLLSASTSIDAGTLTATSRAPSAGAGPVFGTAGCNTLPIELLSFTANCKKDKVNCKWITASEINNNFFTLERSNDASYFEAVATINGAGNSNSELTYEYIDSQSDNKTGNTYYRLKQTDFDGKFTYSGIVAAKCNNTENELDCNVYPNPTNQVLTVDFAVEISEEFSVEIKNCLGQVVLEQKIPAGTHKIQLSMADLIDGTYFISVMNKQQYFTHKIIKIN